MGMFDYLRCDAPLPFTEVPPPLGKFFQTKDTPDQYMTLYRITSDGRLLWRPYTVQEVPKNERPYPDDDGLMGMCGMWRRVEGEEEALPFHGDIRFYASNHPDVGWWEYIARFTEGSLKRIYLAEFCKPEGRDRNKEIKAERATRRESK